LPFDKIGRNTKKGTSAVLTGAVLSNRRIYNPGAGPKKSTTYPSTDDLYMAVDQAALFNSMTKTKL
jgi:hypothetical protein